jgi:hypothetical protein
MAAPGANIRFMGVDSSLVDLTEKKSGKSNNKTEYYSLTDLNTNFANTDLTSTGTRTHSTNGNPLSIQVDGFNQGSLYMDANQLDIGYGGQYLGTGATFTRLYYSNQRLVELNSTGVVINENGGNYDFRIEGDTDTNLFFTDASTDRVGIGTTSPSYKLHVADSGSSTYIMNESTTLNNAGLWLKNTVANWLFINNTSGNLQIYDQTNAVAPLFIEQGSTDYSIYVTPSIVTINQNAANLDFRVEGQTDANLFFTDASTDRVGIGTSSPVDKLHVAASGSSHYLTVQSTTLNNAGLRVYNTVGDWRYLCNTSGDLQIYDATSVATPLFIKQGAPNYSMYFSTTEVIINQNAANLDFRVEGQTDANLLFTDASTDKVGIGTNSPSYKFDVEDSVATYIRANSGTGTDSGLLLGENGTNKFGIFSDRTNSGLRIYNYTSTTNPIFIKDSNGFIGINDTTPSYDLDVNGDVNVVSGSAYHHNGSAGLSATYTFGGGTTGDIATMTFSGGILTAVTTVP